MVDSQCVTVQHRNFYWYIFIKINILRTYRPTLEFKKCTTLISSYIFQQSYRGRARVYQNFTENLHDDLKVASLHRRVYPPKRLSDKTKQIYTVKIFNSPSGQNRAWEDFITWINSALFSVSEFLSRKCVCLRLRQTRSGCFWCRPHLMLMYTQMHNSRWFHLRTWPMVSDVDHIV